MKTPRPLQRTEREIRLASEVDALRAQLIAIRKDPGDSPLIGCHDGACIVHRPEGMHTNGGCHCHEDKRLMRMTVLYLRRRVEFLVANLVAIKAELAYANAENRLLSSAFYAAAPEACVKFHEDERAT